MTCGDVRDSSASGPASSTAGIATRPERPLPGKGLPPYRFTLRDPGPLIRQSMTSPSRSIHATGEARLEPASVPRRTGLTPGRCPVESGRAASGVEEETAASRGVRNGGLAPFMYSSCSEIAAGVREKGGQALESSPALEPVTGPSLRTAAEATVSVHRAGEIGGNDCSR